jgi:hypothetical protein
MQTVEKALNFDTRGAWILASISAGIALTFTLVIALFGTQGLHAMRAIFHKDSSSERVQLLYFITPTNISSCTLTGARIDAGFDVNRNGKLDSQEISSTQYACKGAIVYPDDLGGAVDANSK